MDTRSQWQPYIDSFLANDPGCPVRDAAIVCHQPGAESVWASSNGLANITAEEIKILVGSDRTSFFTSGVTMAGTPCTVVNDVLLASRYMLLQTKTAGDKCSIIVAKSGRTLVILKGEPGTKAGQLNVKAFKTSDHLDGAGF